ncbi:helix-turn-helix domain-containing protein [Streptomyces sp. NPDC004031]
MSTDRDRTVQTPRNAWINRVRDEALRCRRPEVCKAFHIGFILASYADADGSSIFVGQETIAAIAGCTDETVSRCLKLLVAVGLLEKRRRPNKTAVYQLLIPAQRPDWELWAHLYTDTRQARRKAAIKAKEVADQVAAMKPDTDAERVPDTVPAGGSGNRSRTVSEEFGHRSGTGSDTVLQRGPEPVPAGGDQSRPTFGRTQRADQEMAEHSPQPQVGGTAPPREDPSPSQTDEPHSEATVLRRCADCGQPVVRPGRTHCAACTRAHAGAA